MQLRFEPPLSPRFIPPPSGFLEFVMLYVLALQLVLLALPQKLGNRILETLFPILRRHL